MTLPPSRSRRVRRWLLNLHLYGGLACSGYLVLYGVSSLIAAHRAEPLVGIRAESEWTRVIPGELTRGDSLQVARQVTHALGLPGRVQPAPLRRTPEGAVEFSVAGPGRHYQVRASSDGAVSVREERRRLGAVILGLHDARHSPDSPLLTSWWYYTHLTVITLLFLAGSGVVLWAISRRRRLVRWGVLVGGSVSFLLFLAWLL